jgi:hypothetical protein
MLRFERVGWFCEITFGVFAFPGSIKADARDDSKSSRREAKKED